MFSLECSFYATVGSRNFQTCSQWPFKFYLVETNPKGWCINTNFIRHLAQMFSSPAWKQSFGCESLTTLRNALTPSLQTHLEPANSDSADRAGANLSSSNYVFNSWNLKAGLVRTSLGYFMVCQLKNNTILLRSWPLYHSIKWDTPLTAFHTKLWCNGKLCLWR